MRILISLFLVAAFAASASAATVTAVHGNIMLNGKPITSGGHDSEPVLSPDGKRIVFARATGGQVKDCAADGTSAPVLELWIVGSDGKGARRLLALRHPPGIDMKELICAFDNTQFSSNGQVLY